VQANATTSLTSEHHHEVKTEEKGKERGERPKEKDREKEKGKVSEKETMKGKDADRKGEPEKEKVKGADNASLDALLQRLPNCINRDLIDQLTVCIDSFVVDFVKIITFYLMEYCAISPIAYYSLAFYSGNAII
jgi:hypothetical protein